MAGNPSDARFRPPDPVVEAENPTAQSQSNEAADGSSSTSSHLREEAIQMATIEAEMDEIRRNTEKNRNTTGTRGEIRVEDLSNLEMVELLAIEEAKSRVMEAAKLHAIEAAKLKKLELAKSRSEFSRLEGSRQQLISGEEAIQVETVEAEFRQNRERNRNLHEQVGDIHRVDNFQELVRGESQKRGEDSEAATTHEIESTKSSSMAAAQSSSGDNRLEDSRQKSVTGIYSQATNIHIQQGNNNRGGSNIDTRQETVMADLQENQTKVTGDGQEDIQSMQIQQGIDKPHKDSETYQNQQQIDYTNARNTNSRTIAIQQIQNRQNTGISSEPLKNQGNITINTNYDRNVQENIRLNVESVGNETVSRNQHYQQNFPKISSNFDRPASRNLVNKRDLPLGDTDTLTKKDQSQEPAPYTVIQTYADRLRFNQSKKGVSINLTEPEITTKQGLPAVLYVKDEVMKGLASTCRYTLIGKFIYTMPRVELIRKNFILQTQLAGGVKIAHFNSRHVYIDLDNELDYNMVWTKQRMNIAGQVMRIQAWTPTFKPDEETPLVPIWISLPELPWHCYNKEFITSLLSPIGRVLYLDSASINKTRGSQARVKVQVDLTKERPSHIWMGYMGEDITDGRWQKIDYDNIPDYCFYCKHQGHKEVSCIIKQRDEENKKRKEMEKNKAGKDNGQNVSAEKHLEKSMDVGRRELDYNQSGQQVQQTQQQMTPAEWQTQRRRHTTQQVRFTDRSVVQHPQMQTGIVSIPIQNTYIDLEVQEFNTLETEVEEQSAKVHEMRTQNINRVNKQSQRQDYNTASKEQEVHNNNQQRMDLQLTRTIQTGNQQRNINNSGMDTMPPSNTLMHTVDNYVGVAVGGEAGCGQGENNINQTRIDKGKGKMDDQGGYLTNISNVPPDKPKVPDKQQVINTNNASSSNIAKDPTNQQRIDNDEYKEPDSEDEIDEDTQSLGEGRTPIEIIETASQIQSSHLLHTSNVDDIREVTGKQGLSPRGRKLLKNNQNTSVRKPNTRARSRGL